MTVGRCPGFNNKLGCFLKFVTFKTEVLLASNCSVSGVRLVFYM